MDEIKTVFVTDLWEKANAGCVIQHNSSPYELNQLRVPIKCWSWNNNNNSNNNDNKNKTIEVISITRCLNEKGEHTALYAISPTYRLYT